jgi:hypothetical protein
MKSTFGDRMFITTTKLLIEDIDQHRAELDGWELAHIDGFKAQLEQGRPLSPNKTKILSGIHGRVVKPAPAPEKTNAAG